MHPTHLVFATLLAAIASDSSADTSSNGRHTDAWKTVNLPDAFYLMYSSFENDTSLGGTGKCFSIQMLKADEATKTTESRMKYWDTQMNKWEEKTVCVTLARSDNSKVDDIIRVGDADNCNALTTQSRLVYSDYGTCDVLVVLETPEQKCELWVKKGYQQLLEDNTDAAASGGDASVKENIAKCQQEYKKLCQEQHQIYDKAICNSS